MKEGRKEGKREGRKEQKQRTKVNDVKIRKDGSEGRT
jgi:hypothetical protein